VQRRDQDDEHDQRCKSQIIPFIHQLIVIPDDSTFKFYR
jgi:hypothetical protein